MKISTSRASRALVSLALASLAACADDGNVTVDERPDVAATATDDAVLIASFELPDAAVVELFAHSDGSITVTEHGDAWHEAVLARSEFVEATAYDLFYALAAPEDEAPEALVAYHEKMVADGEPTMDRTDLPQGWLLEELENAPPPPIAGDPCPGLIQDFVCTAGGGSYPDGPGCFYNLYGSAAWYHGSAPMRRYRTGFCTLGTVDAYIKWSYAGPGDCIVFRPLYILRNGNYTNHNYNYWWSGPTGSTPRSYDNHVEHVAGPGFSWGVKQKNHTSSSCKI